MVGSTPFGRGLVVVAALGSPSDLPLLASNLRHFDPLLWDCLALAYAPLPQPMPHIGARCRVEMRLGWLWGSLLNLTTPALTASYSHVFVLLDDLVLPPTTFNLTELVHIQQASGLDAISPTIAGASRGTMSPAQVPVWKTGTERPGAVCVHLVNVIELFATLFIEPAWRCFHSMFDNRVLHNATHAVAWGYDICFQAHCAHQLVGRAQMGIVLHQMAVHAEGPVSELHAHVETKIRAQRVIERTGRDVLDGGWHRRWATDTLEYVHGFHSRLGVLAKVHKDNMAVAAGYEAEFDLLIQRLANKSAAPTRRLEDLASGLSEKQWGRRLALRQHGKKSLGLEQARLVRQFVWRHSHRECPIPTWRMPHHFQFSASCDLDL